MRLGLAMALLLFPGCNKDRSDTSDTSDTSDSNNDMSVTKWVHHGRGDDRKEVFDSSVPWQTVHDQISAYGFFVNGVTSDARGEVTHSVEFLKASSIPIYIEAGGTLSFKDCDDSNGEDSAAHTIEQLSTLYEVGGSVAYLTLDGPISRVIENGRSGHCGFTLEESVQELADYFLGVHAVYPNIQIGLLTNFPNWTYDGVEAYQCTTKDHGDYRVALEAAITAIEGAGDEVAYVVADNPYNYAIGAKESNCYDDPSTVDWLGRLSSLQTQVQSHDIPFALIYNSASGGETSNQAFYEESIAYVNAYKDAGGQPDIAIMESWYSYPDITLPETEPYTHMNTALGVFATLDGLYSIE